MTDGENSSSLTVHMQVTHSQEEMIECWRQKIKLDGISPIKCRLGIKIQNVQATYKGCEIQVWSTAALFILFSGLECR